MRPETLLYNHITNSEYLLDVWMGIIDELSFKYMDEGRIVNELADWLFDEVTDVYSFAQLIVDDSDMMYHYALFLDDMLDEKLREINYRDVAYMLLDYYDKNCP